jgi:hypothetical protein
MENPKRYALSFLILFFYACQKQILTRQAAVQHNEENTYFIKNIDAYIPPRYILSKKYNLGSGCLCKNSYFEVEN